MSRKSINKHTKLSNAVVVLNSDTYEEVFDVVKSRGDIWNPGDVVKVTYPSNGIFKVETIMRNSNGYTGTEIDWEIVVFETGNTILNSVEVLDMFWVDRTLQGNNAETEITLKISNPPVKRLDGTHLLLKSDSTWITSAAAIVDKTGFTEFQVDTLGVAPDGSQAMTIEFVMERDVEPTIIFDSSFEINTVGIRSNRSENLTSEVHFSSGAIPITPGITIEAGEIYSLLTSYNFEDGVDANGDPTFVKVDLTSHPEPDFDGTTYTNTQYNYIANNNAFQALTSGTFNSLEDLQPLFGGKAPVAIYPLNPGI